MKATLVISLAVICSLILLGQSGCSDPKVSRDVMKQPSKHQLDADKIQISQSLMDLIENYRHLLLVDSLNHPRELSNLYVPYAERVTIDGKRVPSPMPTSTQLNISVDTILYNKENNICFALIIVQCNYSDISGLESGRKKHPYNAHAVIGYKDAENTSYNLYPITVFTVIGVDSYEDARRIIRYSYFKNLSRTAGGYSSVFNGEDFKYNLGEPDFFEKSPLFQKYDETRYNFQMYHHLGKDYEYPKLNL